MLRVLFLALCLHLFPVQAMAQWVSTGTGMGTRDSAQGLTGPSPQSAGDNNAPTLAPATPTAISVAPSIGDIVVAGWTATDPDGDQLVFSIVETSRDILAISPSTGVLSLSTVEGLDNWMVRNQDVIVTVEVSDGVDTARQQVAIPFDVIPNRPPQIIVPQGWTPPQISAGASVGDSLITELSAIDPDGDMLSWSISNADINAFQINSASGAVSLSSTDGLTVGDGETQNVNLTVSVSDGTLSDSQTVQLVVLGGGENGGGGGENGGGPSNGPPVIIVPDGWTPSVISATAGPGDAVITQLSARDPDDDQLVWSLTGASVNALSINPQTGVVSIANGGVGPDTRPESISFTVQVSDGALSDTLDIEVALAVPNGPPRIIAPDGWTPSEITAEAGAGDAVISQLTATDPENDPLTWSISGPGSAFLTIDPQSGLVSLAEGGIAPETRPDSISFTVQVSDGELSDDLAVDVSLAALNRPPQIIVPAGWMPAIVAEDTAQGATLIDVMAAIDPDGDELTWSIIASDLNIFQIDPQTGVMTLAVENGMRGMPERPASVNLTVQVSDGVLNDTRPLVLDIEAARINTPPQITVPTGFGEEQIEPRGTANVAVGTLLGTDADGDTLTWSLDGADPQVFTINAQTGALTYTGLGQEDQLSCVAGDSQSAGSSSNTAALRTVGTNAYGIVSVGSRVVQDHGRTDFRSKKQNGPTISTGKYHVTLERANHRGGSFTTEARSATRYYTDDNNRGYVDVPALSANTVNSNVTPINSYLVFQNNTRIDLRTVDGSVVFENPILGLYYTDNGYDRTIASLGKKGALYSRSWQQDKLALENGRDIAWIDRTDQRKLHFRSRTAGIGDFLRVITAASNGGGGGGGTVDPETPSTPDICSASLTVRLSDGQDSDVETVSVAFGDPNRKPSIIAPADWMPQEIANDTTAGALVVSVLAAADPDGDTVVWSLEGDDANLFDIDPQDGNIRLSPAFANASGRPNKASVTVKISDGRLTDTRQLAFDIEAPPSNGRASTHGTSGRMQFVSDKVQNIFNQDYTIMARFYLGSGSYKKRYYSWWPKQGWKNSAEKETIFFYGGNDNVGRKVRSGVSLHVFEDTVRLQLGTDYNYLETYHKTKLARNRWHTVMFVVDADQRRKTGNKDNWPIKIYLNGKRLSASQMKVSSRNKQYSPVQTASFAGLGIAGKWKEQNDSRRPWSRHLPLHGGSYIHEVTIWQGNKSAAANAIFNNNGDVADYGTTSAGKPRYSWKPYLWGGAVTSAGQGTLTLPNLANATGSGGAPLAGNGSSRMDGDMHLYPGRFTTSPGWAKAYTQWQGKSPYSIWHQGLNGYFDLLKQNAQHNWSSSYDKNDAGDVKAFTQGVLSKSSRSLK